MKKRCLVTGASGFAGKSLVAELGAHGWATLAYVRRGGGSLPASGGDLEIVEGGVTELRRAIERWRPVVTFHLAGVSRHGEDVAGIESLVRANIELGIQVMESLRVLGGAHVVHAGSYWQEPSVTRPFAPNLYGATKSAFSELLRYYASSHRFSVVDLQLHDTYGPSDNRGKIVELFVNALRTGRTVPAADGRRQIDLLHVRDVARGFLQAGARRSVPGRYERFQLRSGQRITIRALARLLEGIAGRPVPVDWGARPEPMAAIPRPSYGRRALPGWKPTVKLEAGLAELVAG